MAESHGIVEIGGALDRLRDGLAEIALADDALFVDCSDALAREVHTTFADVWHFSDRGHELLAACILEGLTADLQAGAS